MKDWQEITNEFVDKAQECTEDQWFDFLRTKAFPIRYEAQELDETNPVAFPDWIEEIAVDANGDVYGFEGGCYFLGTQWAPIDDYDGLRLQCIGKINAPVGIEKAKKLLFRLVRDTTDNLDAGQPGEVNPLPQLPDLSALPMASEFWNRHTDWSPNDFLYPVDSPDQQT